MDKSLFAITPLETRFMFDGAMAADLVETTTQLNVSEIQTKDENIDTGTKSDKTVVFVDETVENYQSLIDAIDPTASVYLITKNNDGFEQMAKTLDGQSDIASIHILGHGDEGTILLGTSTLDQNTLEQYENSLQAIGQSLIEDGDILFYGCHVGAGENTQTFVDQIATLTNADIAVSDDITGRDGDWELEVTSGLVEAESLNIDGYDGNLANTTKTLNFTTQLNSSQRVMDTVQSQVQSTTGQNITFSNLSVPTGYELVAYNQNTSSWDAISEGQVFSAAGHYDGDSGVGLTVKYGLRGTFNSIGTVTATWDTTSGSDTGDYTINVEMISNTNISVSGITNASTGGLTAADQLTSNLNTLTNPMTSVATGATNRPVLQGYAVAPGNSVTVFIDGVDVGTTTADVNSVWTFTPTFDLAHGSHTVYVRDNTQSGTPRSADMELLIDIPPVIATSALTYVEGQGAKNILSDITLSQGSDYGGGSIKLTLATSNESLSYASVSNATDNGVVSVSGTDILLGTGSGTNVIGQVVTLGQTITWAFNTDASVSDATVNNLFDLVQYTNVDRHPSTSLSLGISAYSRWNAADIETLTITTTRVNNALDLQASTAGGNQKSDITIPTAAWLYSDAENDSATKFRINSLPDNGILKLDGVAVTQFQEITAADIAANKLTFTPTGYWTGSTSFSWDGHDGTEWSTTPTTMTITVSRAEQTPILTVSAGKAYTTAGGNVVVDPGVMLVDPNAGTGSAKSLTAVYAAINDAQTGDALSVDSTLATTLGITASWDASTNMLTMTSAGLTAAQYQSLLRTVTLSTTGGAQERNVVFSLTAYNPTPTYTYTTPSGMNGGQVLGVDDTHNVTWVAWDAATLAQQSYAFKLNEYTSNWFSAVLGSADKNYQWSSDAVSTSSVASAIADLFGIDKTQTLSNFSSTYVDTSVSYSWGTDPALSPSLYGTYPTKFKYVLENLPTNGTLALGLGGFTIKPFNLGVDVSFTGRNGTNIVREWTYGSGDTEADAATDFNTMYANLQTLLGKYNLSLGSEFPTAFSTTATGWARNLYVAGHDYTTPTRYSYLTVGSDGVIHGDGSYAIGQSLSPSDVVANSYVVLGFKGVTPTNAHTTTNTPVLPTADGTQGYRGVLFSGSNSAPTITAFSKSGTEGQTLSFVTSDFSSKFTDPENDSMGNVTITALPNASHGTLSLNGTAVSAGQVISVLDLPNLTFTPASNFSGAATFNWQASDGTTLSNVGTATLNIAAVNHAPTLVDNRTNNLTSIDEDIGSGAGNTGTLVSDMITNGAIADTDVGTAPEAIALTAVDNTNGKWQYNTGSGWSDVTGTTGQNVVLSSMLLLDENARMRFVPNADYNGTASLNFRPWDKTQGSSGSTTSSTNSSIGTRTADNGSASITVNPVNDAPTLSSNASSLAAKMENNTSASTRSVNDFISAFISDVDTNPKTGMAITGVTNAANGNWRYSTNGGTSWTSITSVSNAQALALRSSDLLDFIPDNENGGTATLTWRGWDQSDSTTAGSTVDLSANTSYGDTNAYSSATHTTSISIIPVNTAPTLGSGTGGPDFAGRRIPITGVSVGDPDAGSAVIELSLSTQNGKINLGGTNGLTVTSGANGSRTVTVRGTISDLNAALTGLTFDSAKGFVGASTITAQVSDLGNTGVGGTLTANGSIEVLTRALPAPPSPPAPAPAPPTAPTLPGGPLTTPPSNDTPTATVHAVVANAPLFIQGRQAGGDVQQVDANRNSFQVPVAVPTLSAVRDGSLFVNKGIPSLDLSNRNLVYNVPIDAFGHSKQASDVQLSAKLADGTSLPSWLSFDTTSGTFVGEVPDGVNGELAIVVTARDQSGSQVSTLFKINTDGANTAGNLGEPLPQQAPLQIDVPQVEQSNNQTSLEKKQAKSEQQDKQKPNGRASLSQQLQKAALFNKFSNQAA
ncbi:DUF4347 domain-containing protein [Terasakiella sp. SH-1]|uniref:DUF4347 domain-containing protein n=1 Tax=Terasakiella sp. SH-1 TaxID=2560057 RepID=UPI001073CBF1|nr:DUF4347 domain-containing protein [Terasakiella sp. SH-1]